MLWWLLPVLALGVAKYRGGPSGDAPESSGPVSREDIRAWVRASGVPTPDLYADLLAATAHRESRMRPLAENTSPGEAAAARTIAERIEDQLCFPARDYSWGSGGLYGMLAPLAFRGLRGVTCEYDPGRPSQGGTIGNPRFATLMALAHIAGLQRWASYGQNPSLRTLARGWPSPGYMDGTPADAVAQVDARLDKNARAVGVDPLTFAATPERIPDDWAPSWQSDS